MRASFISSCPLKVEEALLQSDGFPGNFLVVQCLMTTGKVLVLWKGSYFRKIHLLKFPCEMFIYRGILPK